MPTDEDPVVGVRGGKGSRPLQFFLTNGKIGVGVGNGVGDGDGLGVGGGLGLGVGLGLGGGLADTCNIAPPLEVIRSPGPIGIFIKPDVVDPHPSLQPGETQDRHRKSVESRVTISSIL